MSEKRTLLESVKSIIDLQSKISTMSAHAESVKAQIKDELADAVIDHTIGLKEFEKVSEKIDTIDQAATATERYVDEMAEPLARIKEHLIYLKPGYSLAYIDPATKIKWLFSLRQDAEIEFMNQPA